MQHDYKPLFLLILLWKKSTGIALDGRFRPDFGMTQR